MRIHVVSQDAIQRPLDFIWVAAFEFLSAHRCARLHQVAGITKEVYNMWWRSAPLREKAQKASHDLF